ncbi:MAG: hypothetical protein V1703_03200 [Candidatus Altiarchaeota archaeon]
MKLEERIPKIRDFAIIIFCLTGTIAALLFIVIFVGWMSVVSSLLWNAERGSEPLDFWADCIGDTANVYINANEDVKNVKCTALDTEFFAKKEVSIGDLSKGDSDVCSFKLLQNATQPLRFELGYNDKVERIVCNWQPVTGFD